MKKLTLKISLIAIMLGAVLPLSAQTVKGVVKDSDGEPLVGVSVILKGATSVGTTTGNKGDYVLNVPASSSKILVFSFVGMKTQEIPVDDRSVINVVLKNDNTYLDEVVVVGYAKVKRRDLIGSVSSVSNQELTEVPVTSVNQALSGKMAGVSVTMTEGDPDADIKIRVRGGGSITQDSSPLYIVDGFPVESISDIPASTIQSIDVLKDAFSTAIYGARGANGVVIVTTKSGTEGKLTVSLNTYYGLKKIANKDALVPMDADNFVKFQYELASVRDNIEDNYEPYFGTFDDIDQYTEMETNDWVSQVFGNQGSSYSADLTLSGGNDKVRWTAGYAHMTDNAIMLGSSYARNNLNLKAQYKPYKNLSFDFSVRYSQTTVNGSGANGINDSGTTSGNGRLKHAISYTPIPIASTIQGLDEEADYGDNAPPVQSVWDNDKRENRAEWNANGAMTWGIIKNLNLKIEGGMQDYDKKDDRFYGLTTYYVNNTATIKGQPAAQYKDYTRTRYRSTNTLSYDFKDMLDSDSHHIDVLLGQEYIQTVSNTVTNWVEGFPDFFDSKMAWNFLSSGTAVSTSNYYDPDDKLLSFFGRVNYSYKGIYSLSATMRADGSSKFSSANRWGYFPSAAASWRISGYNAVREKFPWLSTLKLRYSYGTAGNNNIPSGLISQEYAAYATTWISQGTTYWTTVKGSDGKTIMSNPDLKWETTITNNIGLDFGLFKDRLNGSVEVYRNDTRDLLIKFPTSGSGYDYQYRNIGSTMNRGVELTLNGIIVNKKDFGLNASFNIAYNRNEVISLGGLDQIEATSYWASTEVGTDYLVQVGKPLGNMYGYKSDGRYEVSDFTYTDGKWVLNDGVVDDSGVIGSTYLHPGAMKLKDLTNDGKVTVADKTIIGNASPKLTGGFSLSGYLFGFDLSANFNYVWGNDIYNANKIEFTSSRKFYNRNLLNSMDVDKRWTNIDWTTGQLIDDPDALAAANANTTMWSPCVGVAVLSDYAVEDGSFVRLNSATLGYTLPEKLTQKFYISRLRFYATGTNLWLLTNYSGYDPEVDTRRSTPLTPGVDYSAYPKSIGCVFGINITF
ncbi:MAG: TonB-dependent receptor [Bacteroidales bacterium]|jgi:TonB-linked SusC/RagA family outer membrane protein|nr:TonB-dependent receptor [Bacteroidales bacterium]MCI2122455.1 TonB-dependent receptor [Bacteroidales bacterium]MCI2145292.1 TonB-dependent receptor [Bacteroidales bacterium]